MVHIERVAKHILGFLDQWCRCLHEDLSESRESRASSTSSEDVLEALDSLDFDNDPP